MDSLPFWKKFYQTVTGYSANITNDLVEEVLRLSEDNLLNGTLLYKKYTDDGNFEKWCKNSPKVDMDVQMFVRRLAKELNLETTCSWLVLCNYFMFEYHGKIKDIKAIVRYESNTAVLIRNIWQFYSTERLLVLKTLRYIFEYVSDKSHPFCEEYVSFIKNINVGKLKTNLIRQFKDSVGEITPENASKSDFINFWIKRNNQEQIEILMILCILTEYTPFTIDDFNTLFSSFMLHSFTRHPLYFESTRLVPEAEFYDVKCSEVALFVLLMNKFGSGFQGNTDIMDKSEKELLNIQVQGDQKMVLLAWIVIKLKSSEELQNSNYYQDLVLTLFNNGVMLSLYGILQNDALFVNSRAGRIFVEAIYDLLNEVFSWFPDERHVFMSDGTVLVLASMLKNPLVVEKYIEGSGGIPAVVKVIRWVFPYDFHSFTAISKATLESGYLFQTTVKSLCIVNSYLSDLMAGIPDGQYYILNEKYEPFGNDSLSFPQSTKVQSYNVFGKNLSRFIVKYNYFTLLEQMFLLFVNESKKNKTIDVALLEKIMSGYEIVNKVIKSEEINRFEILGMNHCLEVTDLVWPLFSEGSLQNFHLVKLYFEIQSNLIIYRQHQLQSLFLHKFLPVLSNLKASVTDLSYKNVYENSVILHYLQQEESLDEHDLLNQYLELIKYCVENNQYHTEVQLPGVVYLLNSVFSFYNSWIFKSNEQKMSILTKCFIICHKVLQQGTLTSKHVDSTIFELVMNNFLHNTSAVQAFFTLLVKGAGDIQNVIGAPHFSFETAEEFKLVRLQLSVLLLLLKYRKQQKRGALFYEKLMLFTKPIMSLIDNAYNSQIGQLSCRIIEVMSRDSNIPILALLEMDDHQVQSFFLEKLRDPIENEELKIAIVDLVETCIKSQNGMTAAFFNVATTKCPDGDANRGRIGDSMTDFMLDYLHNIKKTPDCLKNPLQLGILKILMSLWTCKRSNLIQDVIALKQFWPLLANPLYCKFNQNPEIYQIIFSILTIQLWNTSANVDASLKNCIQLFFKDKTQVEKWLKVMDSMFQNAFADVQDEEASRNNFSLLKSWIEFVIISKKYIPDVFDDSVKYLIIEHCLDGTLYNVNLPNHVKTSVAFMELYLMLITDWNVCGGKETEIIGKLTKILRKFNTNFNLIPHKMRRVYLSVIHKTINNFAPFFESDSTSLRELLIPIGRIVNDEYEEIYNLLWTSSTEDILPYKITNWVLVTCIANSLMRLKNMQNYIIWFKMNNYLEKIINSFRPLLYNRQTTSVVKFMMESLICYAETPMVFDFLSSDLVKVTENMRIPDNFNQWKQNSDNTISVFLREWCTSFMLLIKLMNALLAKLGEKMVASCCHFLMLHEKITSEILKLCEHSADMRGLILIRELLDFINTLMDWKYIWYCYHKENFMSILSDVKKCINACSTLILKPRSLVCYNVAKTGKLEMTEQLAHQLVLIIDMFIDICRLSSHCLLKCSRTPVEYFEVYKSPDPLLEIIENDFQLPRFELPVSDNLTFGRILCVVHFLCKTAAHLSVIPSKDKLQLESEFKSLMSISAKTSFNNLPDLLDLHNICSADTVVFVHYEDNSDVALNEKFSSHFRYAVYECTELTTPWISELNKAKVEQTLEVLMCLMASQVFLYTRTMDQHNLHHYKRELCAELLFINEFVKKRSADRNPLLKSKSFIRHDNDSARSVPMLMGSCVDSTKTDFENMNFLIVISQWFVNVCQLYGDNYL